MIKKMGQNQSIESSIKCHNKSNRITEALKIYDKIGIHLLNCGALITELKWFYKKKLTDEEKSTIIENYKSLVNLMDDILFENKQPDLKSEEIQGIDGTMDSSVKVYLNPDLSDDEKAKVIEVGNEYINLYGETMSLLELRKKDIEVRNTFNSEVSGFVDNPDLLFEMFNKRKEEIPRCQQAHPDDEFYQRVAEPNAEYYPKDNSEDELKKACENIKWGDKKFPDLHKKMQLDKKVITDEKDFEHCKLEFKDVHEKTLELGQPQFVFGHVEDLVEYAHCPKKYESRGMKARYANDGKNCSEVINWSNKLNKFYELCSSKNGLVRFIFPKGKITPYRALLPIPHVKIFDRKPLGVIKITFYDDRNKDVYLHHTCDKNTRGDCHFILYLFEMSDTTYFDRTHFDRFDIDVISGRRTMRSVGLIRDLKSVTYTEFENFVCYSNFYIYKSNLDERIIFFSKNMLNTEQEKRYKIKRIYYECINYTGADEYTKKYLVRVYKNPKDITYSRKLSTKFFYYRRNNEIIESESIIENSADLNLVQI